MLNCTENEYERIEQSAKLKMRSECEFYQNIKLTRFALMCVQMIDFLSKSRLILLTKSNQTSLQIGLICLSTKYEAEGCLRTIVIYFFN